MKKRYKVVGWYSSDPHNEYVRPFARVLYIETEDPAKTSEIGADALDKLYVQENAGADLLNWYVEESR